MSWVNLNRHMCWSIYWVIRDGQPVCGVCGRPALRTDYVEDMTPDAAQQFDIVRRIAERAIKSEHRGDDNLPSRRVDQWTHLVEELDRLETMIGE